MSTVRMYELLRRAGTSLTDEEVKELVSEIESLTNQRFDDRKELLATKVDLAETEQRINKEVSLLRTDVNQEISSLRTEVSQEIASLRTDISREIAASRVDAGMGIHEFHRSLRFWIIFIGTLNALPDIWESFLK